MNRREREVFMAHSNNPVDRNKNICALRICEMLEVDDRVRYLHTIEDLVYALRKKYMVRSRNSKLGHGTVEECRVKVKRWGDAGVYVIWVKDHVFLMFGDGRTAYDTDPREVDERKVLGVYGIWGK